MNKKIYIIFLLAILSIQVAAAGCDDVPEEDDEDDGSQCEPVTSFDFEVFGKVQGVYFRKHTHEMAKKLNLVGWVQNTPTGSVLGQVQGSKKEIDQMEHWLRNIGSPKSKIEKMERKNYKILQKAVHSDFIIQQ